MKIPIRFGKKSDNIVALLFLTPFLIIFLTFLVWPIIYSLILSFQDQAAGYTLDAPKFVGLKNFARLIHDKEFWWALLVTIYYSILIIPTGVMASLFLAILLNNKLRFVKFYRAAYFLPNVLDMLVIGIIWTLIYSKDGIFQVFITKLYNIISAPFFSIISSNPLLAIGGLLIRSFFLGVSLYIVWIFVREYSEEFRRNSRNNADIIIKISGISVALFLAFFNGGINYWIESALKPAVESGILGNAITVMPAVVFALVIKGAGFGMILFLAAIQNISSSVYEAADIDGATSVQKFKYITLPLLKPVILFMVITGTIGALNAFTEIFAMTKGGPIVNIGGNALGATKLTGYFLFTKWEQSDYGYAAAISYALLVLTLIISVINAKIFKSDEV